MSAVNFQPPKTYAIGGAFPFIEIQASSAYEIGVQHGIMLQERVQACVNWYFELFAKNGYNDMEDLRSVADKFKITIAEANPDWLDEMEGISVGSKIELWKIICINCRTEIVSRKNAMPNPTECTSMVSPGTSFIAQNWDWDIRLQDLTVISKIVRTDKNNHTILQIQEPGILGKIGLNSAGIGCTLNILFSKNNTGSNEVGVPVHIFLRSVLDCATTIEDAVSAIQTLPKHYAAQSCITISDAHGKYAICEFNGDTVDVAWQASPACHTNHYCGLGGNGVVQKLPKKPSSTSERYNRASELIAKSNGNLSLQDVKQILGDQNGFSTSNFPIAVPFSKAGASTLNMEVGTVTTVICDLNNLKMHLTPGSPLKYNYVTYDL